MLSLFFLVPILQDAAVPTEAQLLRIDALFEELRGVDTPGAALGIVRDGELVLARGYGAADIEQGVPFGPDTACYVGSVAKQFAALAVLLLEEEGLIDLEADVREWVPELRDYGSQVTADQLLHHAGGLRDYLILAQWAGWRPTGDLLSRGEALDLVFRQSATNFVPGTRFEYSNTGYLLLALIVERASGLAYSDFVHQRILEPLGMSSSRMLADASDLVPRRAVGYARAPEGGFRHGADRWFKLGPGGLFATVEDLARWATNFREPVVGSRELLLRMEQPITYLDGTRGEEGMGLVPDSYRGVRVVHHAGNARGYGAEIVRFPDLDLALIVVANMGLRDFRPTTTALRIADVLLGEELEPEPAGPGGAEENAGAREAEGVEPDEAPRVAGVYARAPRQFFRVRRVADSWEGDYSGGSPFALVHASGEVDRLDVVGTSEVLRFLYDGGERPVALEYIASPGAEPSRYERIQELEPTEAVDFVGTYTTADLPVAWSVSADESGLRIAVAQKTWTLFEALDHIGSDTFTDGQRTYFEFQRGAGGAVERLIVSDPRVRALELRRAPE